MTRRGTRLLASILIVWVLGAVASHTAAQSVTIVLLDGRTAKPVAHSWLNLWGDAQKAALPLTFDSDGAAHLVLKRTMNSETQPTGPSNHDLPSVEYADTLRIQLGYQPCWENDAKTPQFAFYRFSTERILKEGLAEPNRCGSHTVTAKPGELILYVKPLSFLQRMRE